MLQVAKLVIIDNNNKYLLMYRSNHPDFGTDPDIPGGTVEMGEHPIETMIREVEEEAGIPIAASDVKLVYEGLGYTTHGTHKTLYVAELAERPVVKMSWEHSSYEWVDRDEFLEKAKGAVDTYMHMVYQELTKS